MAEYLAVRVVDAIEKSQFHTRYVQWTRGRMAPAATSVGFCDLCTTLRSVFACLFGRFGRMQSACIAYAMPRASWWLVFLSFDPLGVSLRIYLCCTSTCTNQAVEGGTV